MSFTFERQKIEDIILIKPDIYKDERGCFIETYKKSVYRANGIQDEFNQDNYSKSFYKVLRGLHYQAKEYSQAKLVRCLRGRIYDIVLDIRQNSKTYLNYLKIELSDENKYILYVPSGFAHGFVVLSDWAETLYKTTNEYNFSSERGILWCDKDLNIDWGIDFEPILSQKDKNLPMLSEIDTKELY